MFIESFLHPGTIYSSTFSATVRAWLRSCQCCRCWSFT